MATSISPTQAGFHSSSVGTRRKPNTALPSLPASAFNVPTPPPAAKDPTIVIDAFYGSNGVKGDGIDITFEKFNLSETPVAVDASERANLFAVFAGKELKDGQFAASLKWARENAHTVDIAIVGDITEDLHLWESLETLLANSVAGAPIVLSNVLPPPHLSPSPSAATLSLASSPSYQAFQSNVAALSLFSSVSVKLLPPIPAWGEKVPSEGDEKEDWKRRVKMYLGPILEAFGQERIIFGSSTSEGHGAWYTITRETLTELGVEQEVMDDVFGANARRVYGAK
jgi:hypothetical protein